MSTAARETILVVEDDPSIQGGLELNLRLEGYRVLLADDLRGGRELALAEDPDLIVLDLMLPDGSGLDLLRSVRQQGREMQVLILSARGMEMDKVKGLQLGADDYVTKPFSLAELLARIEAALRRPRQARAAAGHAEPHWLEIDPASRRVTVRGQRVRLTPREYDLLLFLVQHRDHVLTRSQLLQCVWGGEYQGTERTVDNFVRALRSKLEPDPARPAHILTVHGVGYRFRD